MKDRVKKLRKELLKLNQTDFGAKIGIGQQAVGAIENGTNTLTERNIDAICQTWRVNPEWLRNGVGETFLPEDEKSVESIMARYDLERDEAVLMSAFLELPAEYRAGVVAYVKKAVAMFEARLDAQVEQEEKQVMRKPDNELTKNEVLEIIGMEYDAKEAATKRATIMSSASTGTNGLSKKFGKVSLNEGKK